MAAQFLRCRGRPLWLQRCDFRTVKNPFPLTTAAQNIHIFPRKSPLCRSHFFEWLKTAISSNACGTSTLKSPPSRAFAAPHVHPRLRKRPPRCTLDCGVSKPRKAPHCGALWLRGAQLRAPLFILCFNRTAISIQKIDSKSSKSHLKSLPRISPKSYRHRLYLKPFLIAIFNFSHKRPTFAFTGESGYTLGFRRRIAHSGLHAETGGVSDGGGITTLGAFRTFGNPAWPGVRTAYFAAFGPWPGVLPKNAESLRNSDALMRVAVPRRRGPAGLRDLFATW